MCLAVKHNYVEAGGHKIADRATVVGRDRRSRRRNLSGQAVQVVGRRRRGQNSDLLTIIINKFKKRDFFPLPLISLPLIQPGENPA